MLGVFQLLVFIGKGRREMRILLFAGLTAQLLVNCGGESSAMFESIDRVTLAVEDDLLDGSGEAQASPQRRRSGDVTDASADADGPAASFVQPQEAPGVFQNISAALQGLSHIFVLEHSRIHDALKNLRREYETRCVRFPARAQSLEALDRLFGQTTDLRGSLQRLGQHSLFLHIHQEAEIFYNHLNATRGIVESEVLAAQANHLAARYARRFVLNSSEQDLGLLEELIERLSQVQQRMASITAARENTHHDRSVVERNLTEYRRVRTEVLSHQNALPPQTAVSILAMLANKQFALYRAHFWNRPILALRPELLARILRNLERIRTQMIELPAANMDAIAGTVRDANVAMVEHAVREYRATFADIQNEHAASEILARVWVLGSEANRIMNSEYGRNFAGRDARSVSLTLLESLCEQLDEIEMQLHSIARTESDERVLGNLASVSKWLDDLEAEYENVARAQQ